MMNLIEGRSYEEDKDDEKKDEKEKEEKIENE
jgi:hypothetical protein